jgi:hypothetical protein
MKLQPEFISFKNLVQKEKQENSIEGEKMEKLSK